TQDLVSILLPSQHDRTILGPGSIPRARRVPRNLLRTGLARSSRYSPCPTATTDTRGMPPTAQAGRGDLCFRDRARQEPGNKSRRQAREAIPPDGYVPSGTADGGPGKT